MDAFDYNTEMARAEYLVIDSAMKLEMYDVATAIRIEWSSSLKTTMGNARTFWRPPSGLIKLSMDLWARAGIEQRTETIIHEAAHILANLRNKSQCGHDSRWRQVMAELGYPNASRCHEVDTEGLRRRQTRYRLLCPCGKMHTITSRWRTKAMRTYGPGSTWKCNICGQHTISYEAIKDAEAF